MVHRI